MNTEDFDNAIQNFQEAYKKNVGKGTEDYNKVRNSLGYCYLKIGDNKNARFYFQEAVKSGSSNSKKNIQIIDSIENVQKVK